MSYSYLYSGYLLMHLDTRFYLWIANSLRSWTIHHNLYLPVLSTPETCCCNFPGKNISHACLNIYLSQNKQWHLPQAMLEAALAKAKTELNWVFWTTIFGWRKGASGQDNMIFKISSCWVKLSLCNKSQLSRTSAVGLNHSLLSLCFF